MSERSRARVVALVPDLMDRSRVAAAIPDVEFVRDPTDTAGASAVIVDLVRYGDDLPSVREGAPTARVVGFAPHVERELAAAARRDGADLVLPRSRFFADPGAALGRES